MNADPIDPSAMVDSLVPKGGPPVSNAEGSSRLCGIYGIWCAANEKWYVGQSRNIVKRWRDHRLKLRRNRHVNPYLQNAWNKYGASNFRMVVLEEGTPAELSLIELQHTDRLDARIPHGFVIVAGGDHTRETAEELRRALSAALSSRHKSAHSKWLQDNHLADVETDTHRYCHACLQLKPVSDFYTTSNPTKRYFERRCKRCRYTTDPRNQGRVPHGTYRPFTAEHRRNLSLALAGRRHSSETRARMSAAQKLRRATDETKARMRAAWVIRKLKTTGGTT